MDHIFGNSDDISFGLGAKKPIAKEQNKPVSRDSREQTKAPRTGRFHDQPSRSSLTPRPRVSHTSHEPPTLGDIPPLTRLISGMKSSFLPNEEDMNLMRVIALSESKTKDPLMLIRADNTTVLLGSGFGTVLSAGKEYPTFPDMRLIFSEKERLSAWILTDESVQVELFEYILPTLDFPPIYATRDIIAKFRNNIKNPSFLDKCRFFELFTPGVGNRRIGDLEFFAGNHINETILAVRATTSSIGWTWATLSGVSPLSAPNSLLAKTSNDYMLDGEKTEAGEILMFRGKGVSKHSLKFTFDTFYVDSSSIGVVAGYTLSDREMLAENGILTFTLEEDARARTIAGHIFIDSRGFVHSHEMMAVHKEILKGIRATYEKLITENERIERGELVQSIRREITKYCFLLTGRTPVVMPIIIER